MKRTIRLLALLLALAMVAAACGDDDESTETGTDADAVSTDDGSAEDDAMEDDDSDSADDDAMEDEDSDSADDSEDAMEDDAMEDEDSDSADDDAMEDEDSEDAMEDEGAAVAPTVIGLAITSINFDSEEVVIVNNSDTAVELDGYFLCNFPDYAKLEGVGSVAPGESVTVISPVGLSAAAGELGLYTIDSYSDPNAIQAYVEWGTPDHERASVAIEAGIYDGNPLTVDGNTLVAG